ncbi:MAG: tetratricopeptide repeat protein [Clostridiales bacterium]|nr:tetratricopeptide repeat protein [Clostridiales bacterium]
MWHPLTANSYKNLGYVYEAMGNPEKSLEYFNKAKP